jgi:hypothetical protein
MTVMQLFLYPGRTALAQWPPPAPTFDNWLQFSLTSNGPFDNNINTAIVGPDGKLYVAGSFRDGNYHPGRVARWTGTAWEVLGDRLTQPIGTTTTIDAIAADASGNVYVSGSFTTAYNPGGAGVDANHIAKWDEALHEWQAVGRGTVLTASALCVYNNDLYVGGIQLAYNADNTQVTIPRVGRWNTASNLWEPVGQGVTGFVSSMIATGSGFYVSGGFLTARDSDGKVHNVNGVAFWNGARWDSLGNGLSPLGAAATDLTIDAAGRLYCIGPFQGGVDGNGTQVPGKIVRWDGAHWSNEAPGFSSLVIVTKIEVDSDDRLCAFVYDGTTFTQDLQVRDGSGVWVKKGRFSGEVLSVIAGKPNLPNFGLYAGGLFTQILDPSTSQTFVITNNARLVGGLWQEMVSAAAPPTGTVYALGLTPLQGSVSRVSQVYAGGSFGSIEGIPARNIARTDGLGWGPVGRGVNGTVYSIANAAGWVFVGGSFSEVYDGDGNPVAVNNLALWNPSTGRWSPVGGGVSGTVYALDAYILAGLVRLFAGGDFDSAFVDPNRNGERVNSIVEFSTMNIPFTPWEVWKMGNGLYGRARIVRAIGHLETYSNLTPDGHLYIGGSFTGAQDINDATVFSPNIIKWSPHDSTWSAVGGGVNNDVRALALDNPYFSFPRVWVGGEFDTATNADASALGTPHLALWDDAAAHWNALQSGTDSAVYAIARVKGTDYDGAFIGGTFVRGQTPHLSIPIEHVGLYMLSDTVHEPFRQNWNMRVEVGNGTNGPVYSLLSLPSCTGAGENIYVGGSFSIAGLRTSGSLARWRYSWNPPVMSYSLSAGVSATGTTTGGHIGGRVSLPECTSLLRKSVGDDVLFDSLAFRGSAVVNGLPFGEPFTMYIERENGSLLAFLNNMIIDRPVPRILTFIGVDDTTLFASNPEGRSTQFTFCMKELPFLAAESSSVQLVFVHAVTDAPTVNVALQGGATLVEGLSYGRAADTVVSLPPGQYVFDILRTSNGGVLGTYPIDLTGQAGEVVMLGFSGFLNPSANQNGPASTLDEFSTGTNILSGVGREGGASGAPREYSLSQNFPNPFNPTTSIRFEVPHAGFVSLKVYDILGREVATVANEVLVPGRYERPFDGRGFASGVYLYRLTTDRFVDVKKLLLLK